jgi:sugar/nucleoside kinase (ribokinase family)
LGRAIRHRLHDEGLDEKAVAVDAAHPTGMVTVDLDEGG